MTYDKDSFLAGLSVGMSLRYSKRISAPTFPYLTFSSPSSFILSVNNATKNWDGTIESSVDTQNWASWDGTTALSSTNNHLYLRGRENTHIVDPATIFSGFVINGSNVSCNGDIRTLLDYTDPENTVIGFGCFSHLFFNCSALVRTPSLPSVYLSYGCYSSMFQGCTGLTVIPSLPAPMLAGYCYFHMFYGCTGIKISALQIGEYQTPYRIPQSGSGTSASNAFEDMFLNTGGTFTGTPTINTTYYTSNTVIS